MICFVAMQAALHRVMGSVWTPANMWCFNVHKALFACLHGLAFDHLTALAYICLVARALTERPRACVPCGHILVAMLGSGQTIVFGTVGVLVFA